MVFGHGRALLKDPTSVKVNQRKSVYCRPDNPLATPDQPLLGKDPFRADPRRIGYIRVSTASQLTDRQQMQLDDECDEVRIEYVSAVAAERPVFDTLMRDLRPRDTLVVLDLDRAFRSSIDAMLTADDLRDRQIFFRILSLPIDTTTAEGELFYTLVAAFANFERRIISRRTKEGMQAARQRGVRFGRPAQLDEETIREAYFWMDETGYPCAYVAALLHVSRQTLQRGFHRLGLRYPIRTIETERGNERA